MINQGKIKAQPRGKQADVIQLPAAVEE